MKKATLLFTFFAIVIITISFTNCKENKQSTENLETEITMPENVYLERTNSEYKLDEVSLDQISGGEYYDQMLDEYDEYVTEYVGFYKKAMNGNHTAMAEYPALIEKANKLQERIEQAQVNNYLSASQVNRMVEIQNKMTDAIQ